MTNELRQMPHNLDAERAVLGSVLMENKCLPEVASILRVDDFYAAENRAIYSAFEKLDAENKPIDPTMVREQLETDGMLDAARGPTYIIQLESAVLSPRNVVDHCKVVKTKAVHRGAITLANELSNSAYDDGKDITSTIGEAHNALLALQQNGSGEKIIQIKEPIMSVMDNIDDMRDRGLEMSGKITGFPRLDSRLGGLNPGDLIIIAARTSVGKTALALSMTYTMSVKYGFYGLWFSSEMSDDQLAQRLLSIGSKVPLYHIRSPCNMNDQALEILSVHAGQIGSAPIFVDDTPSIDISDLRARARYFKNANPKLGYIVVDYIQLLEAQGTDNDVARITRISHTLKQIGRECNVPVIALAQINRGGVERPYLHNLKGSGSLEEDADAVLILHRPDDVDRKMDKQPIQGFLDKNRHGQPGENDLVFHGPTTTFKEYVHPDEH